ncbi:MAG: response regulator [Spirochaetaceae bacterium]
MIKNKIRTQFLILFLVIGIIPLIIIGSLFFFQTSEIIKKNSFEHILSIHKLRSNRLEEDINHHFSEFETLLSSQGLNSLISSLEDENIKTKTFEQYVASFLSTNHFYNLYILSTNDELISYSFRNEQGLYNDTGLSRVKVKALNSNEIVFEDFSKFSPSMNKQSAFIAKTYKKRVIVLQFTEDFIDSILNSRDGMGDTGESYIVAHNPLTEDFHLRSNLKTMGDGLYRVGYLWPNNPLKYWEDAIELGFKVNSGIYIDSAGSKVLVEFNKLNVAFPNWYLFSKIDHKEVIEDLTNILFNVVIVCIGILLLIAVLSLYFSKKLTEPIIAGVDFAKNITDGNFDTHLDIHRNDELGLLAKSLKNMGKSLREQAWLRQGREDLDNIVRGEHDVKELGTLFISFMAKYLDAQVGALYILEDDGFLHLSSSYAFTDREGVFDKFALGEGIVGQCALEKHELVFTDVPQDSPEFNYALASIIPTCYITTPLIFEDELIGVFLIGITVPVTTLKKKFITNIKNNISILINSARSTTIIQNLLEDTQHKQEELRASNEELENQTEALKDSEKDMQAQQEELRVTNEELEERTDALEKQRLIMKEQNRALEESQEDLVEKATDLEKASQYKSEFLANMSHELRTPLNSILILSQLISNNKKGNLDEKQIKSAKAINSSGEDLLKLINEVLDLSKVEAGKIDINPEVMTIDSLIEDMERIYRPSADQKKIDLKFSKDKKLPGSIVTDSHRLQQVIKNLMTNALKFTNKKGTVSLNITLEGENVEFSVKDSGIGIPLDKQDAVFEAFQQADGSTSRKYGGTGLGLSISRDLIKLLGGSIRLESEIGKGSTFIVTLPLQESVSLLVEESITPPLVTAQIIVKDDRERVTKETKTLLIIEDDVTFAAILKEQAHDRGFKVLVAEDGETGLHFADYYRPCAIILDIGLPSIDGWNVMERLKSDSELRHIPVHFMSGEDKELSAMQMGALGYMKKPVSKEDMDLAFERIENSISERIHKILIVEDDRLQRESLTELISGRDVSITDVETGQEAYDSMKKHYYNCVILDLGLGDMSGYDLLDKIKNDEQISKTPVIIYTGRDLSSEQELQLKKYADSIIIKGVKSPERLLEEIALFLHRVDSNLPQEQQKVFKNHREEILTGKKILIVDDDMRNIFALSNILEEKDINIIVARDGLESIEKVKENPDIDLVLMDIMMPKMDGYEAMLEIRKLKKSENLPIIALTANAMKGDRIKCIDAGANDYLAKPVDNDKLISMLRVWLY